MAKRSTSLAAQVAELRTLVEQHVQRTKPHCCVRVIYPEHTPEDEIEALKLKAAAEKGVDPDQVTWWLIREAKALCRTATGADDRTSRWRQCPR